MIEFDQNLNPVEPPQPSNSSFTQPTNAPTSTPRPPMYPGGGRGLGMVLGMIVLVLVIAGFITMSSRPNASIGQPEGLTVMADATAYASPDIARVNVGVMKNAKTVADVEKQLADASANIKKALTDAGIKDADIKTVDYSIYPDQTYINGISRVSGYNGRHSMEVTIRDLEKTDSVLSVVTNAGANEIGQLIFTLEKPDDKLAEARKEAIRKAKDKAKQIASDGGFRLGKLTSVSEYSNTPGPMYDYGGRGGGVAVPSTEPGSLSMQVNVTLVYQIR